MTSSATHPISPPPARVSRRSAIAVAAALAVAAPVGLLVDEVVRGGRDATVPAVEPSTLDLTTMNGAFWAAAPPAVPDAASLDLTLMYGAFSAAEPLMVPELSGE